MAFHDLESLPLQIIQLIISHGDCGSALALSAASKTLRSACSNAALRNLIAHGNAGPQGDEWWKRYFPSWGVPGLKITETPTSEWERWALADCRAVQAATQDFVWRQDDADRLLESNQHVDKWLDISWIFTAIPHSMLRWLPQLLAARHPILQIVPPESLIFKFHGFLQGLRSYESPGRDDTPVRVVSAFTMTGFCVAARVLHAALPDRCFDCKDSPFISTQMINLHQFSTILIFPLHEFVRPEDILWWTDRTAHLSVLLHAHGLANGAVAAMAHRLRRIRREIQRYGLAYVIPRRLLNHGSVNSARFPQPPTAIPLVELTYLPAPFMSADDMSSVALRHLSAMATVEFLADGTWTGCHFEGNIFIGPPMERVQISASSLAPDEPELRLFVTGVRGAVSFVMKGSLRSDGGLVDLRWDEDPFGGNGSWYSGYMTPFGVAGSWGYGERSSGFAPGWFWLWKDAWSEPWADGLDDE